MKKWVITVLAAVMLLSMTACGSSVSNGDIAAEEAETQITSYPAQVTGNSTADEKEEADAEEVTEQIVTVANVSANGAIDATDMFTNRDLLQTAETEEAVYYTVNSGENITITSAGVYVLSGTGSEVTVFVEAGDEDKVQLVLDGVNITNSDFPCIYVKNADKVFVTTTDSENSLTVTEAFVADGDTNTDAVIFSKDDLVLNGLGTLTVESTDNGISGKDDLKITGGTLVISASGHAIEANDSICLADGIITLTAGQDGLHAENDSDASTGYIYICGGTLEIQADDDGIHAVTIVQIDGGNIIIRAAEGIEATWIQINGGNISISASDDGVNAASKSRAYTTCFEMNGGTLTVSMGAGDTDAIDSNGNLIINGGTLNITAQSPFDYDGVAQYNGGTIIVNGVETNTITNQMMGGMGGGMQGAFGGMQGSFGGMQGGPGGHG